MDDNTPLMPETPVEPEPEVPTETLASLFEVTLILIIVSIVIALATALFRLDFLPAVLLGLAVVGLNFFLTRQILLRVLLFKDLKRRMFVLYLLKLGISAVVLYIAIVSFQLSGLGVLIGLSNIVIAIFIFSIKRTLFPSTQSS
ncbi:MAG: hypothetical protein HQM13_23830 [SAR324 cluster bacterium]|nr:hypothetical protein [SAR324 cluster bacterium]